MSNKIEKSERLECPLAIDEWLCILSILPLRDMVRTARIHKALWKAFCENAVHLTEGWIRFIPYNDIDNDNLSFLEPLIVKRDTSTYLKNFQNDQCNFQEYLRYDSQFYRTIMFVPKIGFDMCGMRICLPIDTPIEWLLQVYMEYLSGRGSDYILYVDNTAIDGDLRSRTYTPPIETHLKISEICRVVTFDGTWALSDLVRQNEERIEHVRRKSTSILQLDISWLSQQDVFCHNTTPSNGSQSLTFFGSSLDQIVQPPLVGVSIDIRNEDGLVVLCGCLSHGVYHIQILSILGARMDDKIPGMLDRLKTGNVECLRKTNKNKD